MPFRDSHSGADFSFLHSKKKKGGGPSLLSSTWAMRSAMLPLFLPPSDSHLLLLSFCSQPMPRSTLYSTAYPFISPFEASLICSHHCPFFFPTPCINSYLKQFTYETHLTPFISPQTRLHMRSHAALALLLHPLLFHTHAHTLPCAMCMH